MKRFWPLLVWLSATIRILAAHSHSPETLPLGALAPDFKLAGADGKKYSLKDYKKKGVALLAINPNNPKSVRLDELGYTDLSDSFAEMKIRAKHKKFNFPYLYDGEKEEVSRAYGPVATPHAFVFDKVRKLRYVGRVDDSERPEFV